MGIGKSTLCGERPSVRLWGKSEDEEEPEEAGQEAGQPSCHAWQGQALRPAWEPTWSLAESPSRSLHCKILRSKGSWDQAFQLGALSYAILILEGCTQAPQERWLLPLGTDLQRWREE